MLLVSGDELLPRLESAPGPEPTHVSLRIGLGLNTTALQDSVFLRVLDDRISRVLEAIS